MHYGIAGLWGMKALVRKKTEVAGQISEPAVTDQEDLGQHSSYRKPVFFIVSVSPREGSPTVWGTKPLYTVWASFLEEQRWGIEGASFGVALGE